MTAARRLLISHLLTAMALIWCFPAYAADPPAGQLTPEQQRQLDIQRKREQERVQGETDQLVRRMGTMIRYLEYCQLGKSSEKEQLDEVQKILGNLSATEMAQVIKALDASLQAGDKDAKLSAQEREQAHEHHRKIVDKLMELMARYEAIQDLEQVSRNLEALAQMQFKCFLQNVPDNNPAADAARLAVPRRPARPLQERADNQSTLHKEVEIQFKKIAELMSRLPPDERERVQRVERAGLPKHIEESLAETDSKLKAGTDNQANRPNARRADAAPLAASDAQWETAGDLLQLARAYRPAMKPLTALKEARDRVQRAIDDQELIHQVTLELRIRLDGADEREAAKLVADESDSQAKLEHETRDCRNLLDPYASAVAQKLVPAEKNMRRIQMAIRDFAPSDATVPEERSLTALRGVKAELDKFIGDAEKKTNDPLVALQQQLDQVKQMIREQKNLEEKTDEADKTNAPERLPRMAGKQDELSKRADDVKDQPSPAKQDTKDTLDKAAKEMKDAARKMEQKKGQEAAQKQKQATEDLEKAKDQLAAQLAEMKERQQNLANLEKLSKQLGNLVEKEQKVAHEADEKAKQQPAPEDTKDLGQKQAEAMAPVNDIAGKLDKKVPDAAKDAKEAAAEMAKAKAHIDDKKLTPAAENAKEAVKDLQAAKDKLDKAIAQEKGKDIPKDDKPEDPAKAFAELQKADQQIKDALQQTKDAEKKTNELPQDPKTDAKPQDRLQQQQKDVVEDAKRLGLDEKEAQKALDKLKEKTLAAALASQKKAAEDFKKEKPAEPKEQKPGDQKEKKPGDQKEKKPGDSKESTPKPGQQTPQALAQKQQDIMEATKQVAEAKRRTEEAQQILKQAEAEAPMNVQPDLKKADQELEQAEKKDLSNVDPKKAQEAQSKAQQTVQKALDALAKAMPDQPKPSPQQANADKPGDQKPGDQKPADQKPSEQKSDEQPPSTAASGNPTTGNKSAQQGDVKLIDTKGEGSFYGLSKRERDMLKQSQSNKGPAEYASQISQYLQNIASGKMVPKPTAPLPEKDKK